MDLKSLALMLLFAAFFAEGVAWARSDDMKKPCVNCHTMHNSQGGNSDFSGIGVQGALLNSSCYGCHTGANTGSTNAKPKTPKVWHLTAGLPPDPPYMMTGTEEPVLGRDTLAGGDFGWVAGNGLKGHDVAGIVSQTIRTPPGGSTSFNTLTCAGTTGCHGLNRSGDIASMYQTHHAVEQVQPMDGSSLAKSYRWLNGVAGYEDSDYELSVKPDDHNQYKGIARVGETEETLSISGLCAKCHGKFHSGVGNLGVIDGTTLGTDPWIRHPVDYEMGLASEYADYGGHLTNAYNVATPVGFDPVPAIVKSTVTGTGDTIITCISCHRAHGSPYEYSLRWDYKNWPGGANSYNGCGDCHTAKN